MQELVDEALLRVTELIQGEKFIVRDLFPVFRWRRLAINDRQTLGILFKHEMNCSKAAKLMEKNTQGQQVYEKL